MDDAQLMTIWQQRQRPNLATPLAHSLDALTGKLKKRYNQLSKLEAAWEEVVPEELRDHTALEGYSGGTLKVLVDTASHRFHIEMLLRGGLLKELQKHSPAPINRVRLIPGEFYTTDPETGERRYGFADPRPSTFQPA